MTQRLSVLLEVPLPIDRIDSYKIEGPFLEAAEKFRAECAALAKKLALKEKIEFATRIVKTKDTTKARKLREPATPAIAPAAAVAPVPKTEPAAPEPKAEASASGTRRTPPWAGQGGGAETETAAE